MQSPDESQLWCHGPGPSLWKLIAEHVPRSELSKIHTELGHFLVDMYTEVHCEAEMWYKLWQENQRGGHHSSRRGTLLSPLTDPPAIKELVRAEVKMLLQTLRERASRGGRDSEVLLLRYKAETVSFALGHLDSCSSDCIGRGDSDNISRPDSHCSVRSCAEDEIEAVRDKLNITDIDQVVNHLKAILEEECEILNRLVQFFKRNLKQRCRGQSQCQISEPSLAELKELRAAIQEDLELYPSSLAVSPASLQAKELKTRFRLSAGQKASDETLQSLPSSLVLTPHLPPPLCPPKPRPPVGPPPTKTSASPKPGHVSSLSRTSQHRNTVLSSKLTRPLTSDQINQCSLISAELHHGPWMSSLSFQRKPQRISPTNGDNPSSYHSIYSLNSECDQSAQSHRQIISVQKSKKYSIPTSLIHLSDHTNSSLDHSEPAPGESEMLNGKKKKSPSTVSSLQEEKDNGKIISKQFHSFVTSESRSDRKSRSHIEGSKNSNFRKDFVQQQSLTNCCLRDHSSHHSESGHEREQARCSQPVSVQLRRKCKAQDPKGQPTRVYEGLTEPESVNMFYQPVPPSRVAT